MPSRLNPLLNSQRGVSGRKNVQITIKNEGGACLKSVRTTPGNFFGDGKEKCVTYPTLIKRLAGVEAEIFDRDKQAASVSWGNFALANGYRRG